ncbi:MAG: prolyl oligopeptidase family serine peptidase [Planctomycetota bacterium]|nr:prolyl oligopeptidase family serine peptidase [Planctomycetota bacterium]
MSYRFLMILVLFPALACAQQEMDTSRGDAMLANYFQLRTTELEKQYLEGVKTKEDWLEKRTEYVQQLQEMLGLSPMPERTPLQAVVTGTAEHPEFTVENIHFQSRPGLYVTGNLYLPKERNEKLPAILYVCGHGRVKEGDVSYGNKVNYHHHGSWFARNGYVCLTIDTLQLGEIEGIHHGTYSYGYFWWLNRGYTPAGVEAWNCIRALDYLQSREEVDGERLGVTGRSGGGAYSWWVAALDQRIKVAVPVAGITDLRNHVVDGTVEGHCDCMFMVNTYQWDYPLVAALMAPRPLLISNTDNDRIFPLDGVYRTFVKTRQVYQLLGAGDHVSLHVTSGPHKDTQELRVHAFRWFNHYLKGEDDLIRVPAEKFFKPEDLRVFKQNLPQDERNTKISHSFVPEAEGSEVPDTSASLDSFVQDVQETLLDKAFRAWPETPVDLNVHKVADAFAEGLVMSSYDFTSQTGINLRMYLVHRQDLSRAKEAMIQIQGQKEWWKFLAFYQDAFGDRDVLKEEWFPSQAPQGLADFEAFRQHLLNVDVVTVLVAPRGVGRTAWDQSPRKQVQHQRRFYLLGESLGGMQVWDVRRALQALRSIEVAKKAKMTIGGEGHSAALALYAGLYEEVAEVQLQGLADSEIDSLPLLNVSRFYSVDQILTAVASRHKTVVNQVPEEAFPFTRKTAETQGWLSSDLIFSGKEPTK